MSTEPDESPYERRFSPPEPERFQDPVAARADHARPSRSSPSAEPAAADRRGAAVATRGLALR